MTIHVVGGGENLWSVSRLYGVSTQSIISANGLPSTAVLVPGLALYIPDNAMPIRAYRIKAGDTIQNLVREFNTNLTLIRNANPGINLNTLHANQVLNIPTANKLTINTLGFFVPTGQTETLRIIDTLAGQLTYIAVVAYSFTNQGFAYNVIEDFDVVAKCKQANITPLLMIRNFTTQGFSAELAGTVLGSPAYRQNLVTSIVNLTTDRGFGGVSLDIEFIPPARRTEFSLFLTELKRALGTRILQVNVHAKAADLPTNRIVGAYDYAAIGNAVDLMAVMTIDYGYPGGPPDPIAPYWWIEQVVMYALTNVPHQKLLIGMALYGYDKEAVSFTTRALSVLAAQNLALTTKVPIQFDNMAKSPWYRYWSGMKENIVWFEDIRSYIEKYKLIDIYKLAGSTFWQVSLPAPQNWAYLSKNIIVVK